MADGWRPPHSLRAIQPRPASGTIKGGSLSITQQGPLGTVLSPLLRKQQYLASIAGKQQVQATLEIRQGHAVRDKRREIDSAGLEQRLHLVPGVEDAPSADTLNHSTFENDV